MPKLTHTLFYKGLMKILTPFGYQKTNPKQTQTKPICKRAKMNTTSVLTNGYKNKSHWRHQKNKAKSNPILKKSKLNITSVKTNSYENKPPWKPKKTNPNQTQFPQSQKQRIFGQFMYAAQTWDRQRRVIVKAEHLVKGDNTRFIVTNLKGEPKELYDELSCQRGDAENRIKEQQLGLFADRTSCHDFVANQFRVALWAAAYILMDTLRRQGLADTELANAQVGTIRNKLLKIGARVICSVRRIVFHLASGYPFRNIFIRVLARLSKLSTPSISSG